MSKLKKLSNKKCYTGRIFFFAHQYGAEFSRAPKNDNTEIKKHNIFFFDRTFQTLWINNHRLASVLHKDVGITGLLDGSEDGLGLDGGFVNTTLDTDGSILTPLTTP